MDQNIKNFIGRIQLGDMQVHDNMAVIPLFLDSNGGPSYITLKEALDMGTFTVTEVSKGGSVPELKAIN